MRGYDQGNRSDPTQASTIAMVVCWSSVFIPVKAERVLTIVPAFDIDTHGVHGVVQLAKDQHARLAVHPAAVFSDGEIGRAASEPADIGNGAAPTRFPSVKVSTNTLRPSELSGITAAYNRPTVKIREAPEIRGGFTVKSGDKLAQAAEF